MTTTIKRFLGTACAVTALSLSALPVQAHAFLDHSDPAVGSTVPNSPETIHLWFTQQLEPAFSTVTVTDKSGASMNAEDPAVDPGNASELDLKLKSLPPGKYTVKWHVLSVDTHTTEGDFSFKVGGK
jgi:methionine-rich copper-binding protein CopC